jgi:hypothetical protein
MIIKIDAPDELLEKAFKQAVLAKGTPDKITYDVLLSKTHRFIVSGIKAGVSVRYRLR